MGGATRRRVVWRTRWLFSGALLIALTGCASGMPWDDFVFEPVFRQARQENRLTFVYLRNYLSVQCTRFEEQILADPAVIAATQGFRRVMIDESAAIDRSAVALWGIEDVPAIVIVQPNGDKLTALQGDIDKDELLSAIQDARRRFAAANGANASGG